MADVQVLRNTNFSAGFASASNPGTSWKMIPATMAAGIDSNTDGKLTFWSQSGATNTGGAVVGPVGPDYRPNPNAQLTASAIVAGYNKNAKLRIQIGDTPYAVTDTPASQPKILAEATAAGSTGEKTLTVSATVPSTYDGSEPIYFAVYTDKFSSGTIANASVRQPSMLQTNAGTAPTDQAPTAPTGLASPAATHNTVSLSWTAGTDDKGVAGYKVYRNGTLVNSQLVTGTAFTDTGLSPQTSYSYTVRTVDSIGQESSPTAALAVATTAEPVIPDTTPPSAPTGLTVTDTTQTSITLGWSAATDNIGVVGYNVYEGATKLNTNLLDVLTYTATGLTADTAHTYTVKAVDAAGNLSAASASVTGTTDPLDQEPEPEPEPEEPEPNEAAQRVADFVGAGDDPHFLALAEQSVSVITAMVRAYTRGNGFDGTQPNPELAAVITTASARLAANPEQLQIDVGTVWTRSAFQGFNLAELFVLNRYRVRAQ